MSHNGSILEKLPAIVDPLPGGKSLTNAVDYIVNWARANSLWPLTYGTSCCAIEMMATGSSHHDWARFGVEVARATPRQADLIILAGTLVEKMVSRLQRLYEQMPEPKYVIAMGACTISGGPFYYDSYSVVKGADRILPIDVYIPGCPPRPEALLYGIMKLQEIIKCGSVRHKKIYPPLLGPEILDIHSQVKKEWEVLEKQKDLDMAEARETFKVENPGYKGFKHPQKPSVKLSEVPYIPAAQVGKTNSDIMQVIREKFPDLLLYEDREAEHPLAESGTDYIVDIQVSREQYLAFINFLKTNQHLAMDFLIQVTAVDWLDHIDVLVHLLSTSWGHKIFVRCSIDRDDPTIESLASIYLAALFHEREVFDFFGVKFEGHPDLRRIFLPEAFEGFPLRKDYSDDSLVVKRPY